ncbi:MAG TPA: SRPBCC family protein, partial [Chitinophagaceae bacterium]|nr:SRPBCC family protein [Chitinophagaceae bacterium]
MIVLYIVLGLIGLLLLAGLFISKDLQANKEIVINKPVDEVFGFIKYLKNQQLYSKWAALDADMKNEYNGIDGQPGFVNHWVGNKKVGEGEQEITAIEEGKAIYTDLRFIKPFKSFAKVKMTAEAIGASSTKVSWGFQSKMNYPLNIMKLFMNMNEMIGKDFSTGLTNLKNLLEK